MITTEEMGEKRSVQQNALYWGVYIKAFQMRLASLGKVHTPDYLHKLLAARFLRETLADPITGEAIETVQSTTKLTVKKFTEYLNAIREYLHDEFGIVVPEQGELMGEELCEAGVGR